MPNMRRSQLMEKLRFTVSITKHTLFGPVDWHIGDGGTTRDNYVEMSLYALFFFWLAFYFNK